jgi:hypothetical protein
MHSCQLPDSASRGVVFRLRISPRIRSQNRNGSKYSVRDLCRTDFWKNPRKSASLPCPFNMCLWKQIRQRKTTVYPAQDLFLYNSTYDPLYNVHNILCLSHWLSIELNIQRWPSWKFLFLKNLFSAPSARQCYKGILKKLCCDGIFKQSMGARNRVGIGLS